MFDLIDEYSQNTATDNTSPVDMRKKEATAAVPGQAAEGDLPELEVFDPQQGGPKAEGFHKFLDDELLGDDNPKTKILDNYKEDKTDDAVKAAIDNKSLIVLHVGAPWCGPCQVMEKNVWPGVEKDKEFKGKEVFLHMNGDTVITDGKGGKNAQDLAKGIESYPTIRVVRPEVDANGKTTFKTLAEHVGGMTDKEVREMIRDAHKKK